MTKTKLTSLNPLCELVYMPANGDPLLFSCPWVAGFTVERLVHTSGFLQQDADIANLSVGIFSKCVNWDTLVKAGDRVEIYRPLLGDPKEKRRRKAKGK